MHYAHVLQPHRRPLFGRVSIWTDIQLHHIPTLKTHHTPAFFFISSYIQHLMALLSFTPNHIRLINACYPAAPLAAGPQYQPNSQELSRLTYYASNKPSKLHKLSDELEKRAKAQARKAQAGNLKFRACVLSLLLRRTNSED